MTTQRTPETPRLPTDEIADPGVVRLGSGCITDEFPPLSSVDVLPAEIADPGVVRLGSGCITDEFPPLGA